ncbi:MAG: hypothetical protein O6943_06285 [Bacteroidetes bacterium]|nr:hypothetical protein [Bacteroidota bacterium]
MKRLNKKILQILEDKTDKSTSTLRKDLSLLRRNFPNATLNACAQVFAQKNGFSVLQKLDEEDKKSMPNVEYESPIKITKNQKSAKKRMEVIFNYTSDNYFINKHVEELNKTYTYHCFTSTYVLIRKVIENLIIDILRAKYPPNSQENKQLYYDIPKRRYKDFSVLLKNLYDKRNDFELDDKKVIERLFNLIKNLKDDANDKAHSLYHIVKNKSEITSLDLPTIIELIKILEKSVGIRQK